MLNMYQPFRTSPSLRNAVERLFQDSTVWPAGPYQTVASSVPVDIEESADGYVLSASLPGWKSEDVNVTIQNNTVTISGEIKTTDAGSENRSEPTYRIRERYRSPFSRSFSFGSPLNADAAAARYDNGVLTLTLPKADTAKPKRISIVGEPSAAVAKS